MGIEPPGDVEVDDDDGVDGDGPDSEDDAWEARKELRYISAVVLERLAGVEECTPLLGNARVLAHLSTVLKENALQCEYYHCLYATCISLSVYCLRVKDVPKAADMCNISFLKSACRLFLAITLHTCS